MKVLLFLAKGFETMEASVFVDIMGWAGVDVVTCALQKKHQKHLRSISQS